MTEEEKKAIEYLKRHIIPCYGNKGRIEFMLNDTLLNLIEKLQKENEERKSEIEIFYKWLSFTCKELGIREDTPIIGMLNEFKNNFIPKDKIREKLERLENQKENYKEQLLIYMLLKNQYKELLEEE